MSKALLSAIVACGVFTALGVSGAHAQMSSSNCMAMGGGMVHCDTMNMGSNDTSATPGSNGGEALGRGLASFIIRTREDAFRKRVGKLMADGDCQGAARMALESGRLELGHSIMTTCPPNSAPATSAPAR